MSGASRAVFLSYASEDVAAAQRLADALRARGIEVWFDKSELRGGDVWDETIRRRIKECALFVPIVSASSHQRVEGYFRLEWKLAVDRSHRIASDQTFLLPVAIDGTRQSDERIPERFREVHWTRLPDGQASSAFLERVQRLLTPEASATAAPVEDAGEIDPQPAAPERIPTWRRVGFALAVIIVLAAVTGTFLWHRQGPPVQRAASASTAVEHTTGSAVQKGSPPEKSVAVLAFVDMSEKHDQEYFSDGLSEELIALLARTPELYVPARTSSFYFKGKQATIAEIARALSVAHVLEGSVRKAGSHLRVTAQLVKADSGYDLWSHSYDRELDDVFRIQEEIAAAVVAALKVALEPADPAGPRADPAGAARHAGSNGTAYNEFLQGKYLLQQRTEKALNEAVGHFQRAIALAPDNALAYTGLADAYALLAQYAANEDPNLLTQARAAALHALALSPELAEAHASLGLIDLQGGHLQDAAPHLLRAIAIDPRYGPAQMWYGRSLFLQGDFNTAEGVFNKALQFDPLSPMLQLNAGLAAGELDRLPEAAEHARQAIQLEPKLPSGYWLLAFLKARTGDLEDAARLFQSATALGLTQPEALGQMSGVYAQLGDCDTAEHWLRAGQERSATNWAVLRAGIAYQLCRHDPKALLSPLQELRQQNASHPAVLAIAAYGFMLGGERAQALEVYRTVEGMPDAEATLLDRPALGIGFSHALEYATLVREAGKPDKARLLVDGVRAELETIRQQGGRAPGLDYCRAAVLALQGRAEAALTALEGAVAAGWRAPDWMEADPALASLRASSKFAALLATQRRDLDAQRSALAGQTQ